MWTHVHVCLPVCVHTHLQSSGQHPQTQLAHTVRFPPRPCDLGRFFSSLGLSFLSSYMG